MAKRLGTDSRWSNGILSFSLSFLPRFSWASIGSSSRRCLKSSPTEQENNKDRTRSKQHFNWRDFRNVAAIHKLVRGYRCRHFLPGTGMGHPDPWRAGRAVRSSVRPSVFRLFHGAADLLAENTTAGRLGGVVQHSVCGPLFHCLELRCHGFPLACGAVRIDSGARRGGHAHSDLHTPGNGLDCHRLLFYQTGPPALRPRLDLSFFRPQTAAQERTAGDAIENQPL
jgi:hypothetical protein